MHILVTNDDGVRAPGIAVLARALAKIHDVTVVAPASEQSGVGHGFTFLKPLMSNRVDDELRFEGFKAYAVTGTPVDCVKLGCFNLNDTKPDIVLSGINRGANLGTDVLYSGTASAALEAVMLGIPAIAVSLNSRKANNYDAAARCAIEVLDYIVAHPVPALTMLNLNVPDRPYEEIHGIMPTQLACRCYDNVYEQRQDPRGRHYFWLSDAISPAYHTDTDESWESEGYATLTPVGVNLTRFDYLDEMRGHSDFEKTVQVRNALLDSENKK